MPPRSWKILPAVIFAFFSLPAEAQFEPLKFAICKKIPADADRLKCFDEIGKAPAPATSADSEIKPAGEWAFKESKSPVDDSPQINALLAGSPDGSGLFLRCQEKRTEVIFMPGSSFFVTETSRVLMRINDLPAVSTSWTASTSNKALFATNPIDFIKLLPDNGKLFLRATGFQGREADATFSLGDVSAAREKVASACKWGQKAPAGSAQKAK